MIIIVVVIMISTILIMLHCLIVQYITVYCSIYGVQRRHPEHPDPAYLPSPAARPRGASRHYYYYCYYYFRYYYYSYCSINILMIMMIIIITMIIMIITINIIMIILVIIIMIITMIIIIIRITMIIIVAFRVLRLVRAVPPVAHSGGSFMLFYFIVHYITVYYSIYYTLIYAIVYHIIVLSDFYSGPAEHICLSYFLLRAISTAATSVLLPCSLLVLLLRYSCSCPRSSLCP